MGAVSGAVSGTADGIRQAREAGENPWALTENQKVPVDVSAKDLGLQSTIKRIRSGEKDPHDNDGIVFENREKFLPVKKNPNYYTEYVHRWPNTETTKAGTYRIVTGKHGEWYYTTDHYETFIRFKP